MKISKYFLKHFTTIKKSAHVIPKQNNILHSTILGNKINSATATSKSSDSTKPSINISYMKSHSNQDAFNDYDLTYGYHDDYEILSRLGSGKYSQVYDGINIVNDKEVVIKVLKPVKKKKIRREIAILKLLKDHENIVQLLDVIVDPSSKTPSIIYEKINHVDFKILFPKLTSIEIKYYMYCILKGLDFAHSKGIMHRDIKPHNIIIDPKKRILKIIDWGLAEVYSEGIDYSVRVASRYFKSPELLVENTKYDYSLDMWSLGCLFAGLIFKKEPFFHGNDNNDMLIKIVKVLGSNDLSDYLLKYNLTLNEIYTGKVEGFIKKPWEKFITPENSKLCSKEALDFLSKLLIFDHKKRITSKDALIHPYFKEIEELIQNNKI